MYNHELVLVEARTRAEETMRRATLRSMLGPVPQAPRMRLFARRVIGLPEAIEVLHPAPRGGHASIDRRLRQLANR